MSRNYLTLLPLLCGLALMGSSCSKEKEAENNAPTVTPEVQEDAISSSVLKNCRFQNAAPKYSFNTQIPPNPIVCDEGLATKVELITPNPLPTGLDFSLNELSLVGIAKEKVRQATYKYYIENASGYAILNLKITVE